MHEYARRVEDAAEARRARRLERRQCALDQVAGLAAGANRLPRLVQREPGGGQGKVVGLRGETFVLQQPVDGRKVPEVAHGRSVGTRPIAFATHIAGKPACESEHVRRLLQ